jgi:hypothetical protein
MIVMRLVGASIVAIGCLVSLTLLAGRSLAGNSFAADASKASGIGSMDLSCAIRETTNKGFLQLQAVVFSKQPVAGRYALSVVKRSASGESQNHQSGSFALTSGHEQILTTIVLDASAAGHYRANLSLESDRGSVSCQS